MATRTNPKIKAFLAELFSAPTAGMPRVFDPWNAVSGDDIAPDAVEGRRERLRLHLSASAPRLLLIGEAPGYQGSRITGVPFTSEALLLEGGVPRVGKLSKRLSSRRLPWREPSSTIVWGALREEGLADYTILWGAFPWHPYGESPLSNRAPNEAEKAVGAVLLRELLSALPDVTVVAVGNVAADSLRKLGVEAEKIRHPSNGGATAFRSGLALVAKRL
ncbi:uracil-DNA glycosylase [Dyella halodurans]|uniref:Uracil-DNA glycosylase n=1 Tax=Dyella halodurans TaxID=1920171 RepID=A0ABV9C062_9GAMM|nr:uracil-DNA glycosylase [Dyella halodurans]